MLNLWGDFLKQGKAVMELYMEPFIFQDEVRTQTGEDIAFVVQCPVFKALLSGLGKRKSFFCPIQPSFYSILSVRDQSLILLLFIQKDAFLLGVFFRTYFIVQSHI